SWSLALFFEDSTTVQAPSSLSTKPGACLSAPSVEPWDRSSSRRLVFAWRGPLRQPSFYSCFSSRVRGIGDVSIVWIGECTLVVYFCLWLLSRVSALALMGHTCGKISDKGFREAGSLCGLSDTG